MIYEFKCDNCGIETSIEASFGESKQRPCECGGFASVRKIRCGDAGSYDVRRKESDDHAAESLGIQPKDTERTLADDRKIDRASAPDYYDKSGVPHWKGTIASVLRRKEKYCRQRGFTWQI